MVPWYGSDPKSPAAATAAAATSIRLVAVCMGFLSPEPIWAFGAIATEPFRTATHRRRRG